MTRLKASRWRHANKVTWCLWAQCRRYNIWIKGLVTECPLTWRCTILLWNLWSGSSPTGPEKPTGSELKLEESQEDIRLILRLGKSPFPWNLLSVLKDVPLSNQKKEASIKTWHSRHGKECCLHQTTRYSQSGSICQNSLTQEIKVNSGSCMFGWQIFKWCCTCATKRLDGESSKILWIQKFWNEKPGGLHYIGLG